MSTFDARRQAEMDFEDYMLKGLLKTIPRPKGLLQAHRNSALEAVRALRAVRLVDSSHVTSAERHVAGCDMAESVIIRGLASLIMHKVSLGLLGRKDAMERLKESPDKWRLDLKEMVGYFKSVAADPVKVRWSKSHLLTDPACALCASVVSQATGIPMNIETELPDDDNWEIG